MQASVALRSACGSSRVLMIGRLRVVADDTLSQICSARWLDAVLRLGCVQHLAGTANQLARDEERHQHVGIFEKSLILEIRCSSRGSQDRRGCRCCS